MECASSQIILTVEKAVKRTLQAGAAQARRFMMIGTLAAFTVLTSGSYLLITGQGPKALAIILIIGGLALAMFVGAISSRKDSLIRAYRQPDYATMFVPYTVHNTDEGIEQRRTSGIRTFFPWNVFTAVYSDRDELFLHVTNALYLYLHRAAFTDETWECITDHVDHVKRPPAN